MKNQKINAGIFKNLHNNNEMLLLPNVWDALSAALVEQMGFKAIATSSSAVAQTRGFPDGEKLPFDRLLLALTDMVNNVNLPVTADIESGYATGEKQLAENIKRLLDTGIVGVNFEDSEKETGTILPIEVQCKRISLLRKTAEQLGIPLFINARTDFYLKGNPDKEDILSKVVSRAKAYQDAGADCIFPIGIHKKPEIEQLLASTTLPVNVLFWPGIPDFETLQSMGVHRVSLGGGFLKIAVGALRDTASRIKNGNGLDDLLGNSIDGKFMDSLVKPRELKTK